MSKFRALELYPKILSMRMSLVPLMSIFPAQYALTSILNSDKA
jgi:hypothetical protein